MIFTNILSGMFLGTTVRELFGNNVSVMLRKRLKVKLKDI